MSKTALFFPGQASQYVGMAKDLYDDSRHVGALYELASDELGVDIARLSFEGPAEELKRTANTQPAILLHSLAVLTLLRDALPDFDYAAGHSLGEYGALAVCGSLTFEDAVRVVVRRAALMEDACRTNPGTMAAIMGLSIDKIGEVCDRVDGVVVPANINSSTQLVISGDMEAVEEAAAIAKDEGAKRAVLLEVGGAFHSPLMEPARAGLEEYLQRVTIGVPSKPVVANVTAAPVRQPDEIKELLARQIVAPVKWAQTMAYLKADDVDVIIEIGPGKVLTGLAKREMQPVESVRLETLEDIRAFVEVGVV
jgi:[acyl-carrier-protein] S-malonyltransferase